MFKHSKLILGVFAVSILLIVGSSIAYAEPGKMDGSLVAYSELAKNEVITQETSISLEEFREKFTTYVAWLDQNTSSNLEQLVVGLTDEEFTALYNSFVDPDGFILLTEQFLELVESEPVVSARSLANQSFFETKDIEAITPLKEPGYPDGYWYNTWIHLLDSDAYVSSSWLLGTLDWWDFELNLLDTDQDGELNDESCSSDDEALRLKMADVNENLRIGSEGACTIASAGGDFVAGVAVIACGLSLVDEYIAHIYNLASDICASQGGWVDSAEIEATYENTVIIAGLIDNLTNQLSTRDDEIKTTIDDLQNDMIDKISQNQEQLLRIEIEKALANRPDTRISYFYLPESQGGILEKVRQVVLDAMKANIASGIDIGNAQSFFDKADDKYAVGKYKDAYDLYEKAYKEITK